MAVTKSLFFVNQFSGDGRYGLAKLIDKRGLDGKIVDWLDVITADCSTKKSAHNTNGQCRARCPDLPRVL